MLSKTLTISIQTGSELVTKVMPISDGEGSLDTDVTVPGSTTDKQVEMQFRLAALKVIYILSDQVLTLETNAADHTGGNSLTINANDVFLWYPGIGQANPFTFDVTTFYFTNAGPDAATVQIRGLKDATP